MHRRATSCFPRLLAWRAACTRCLHARHPEMHRLCPPQRRGPDAPLCRDHKRHPRPAPLAQPWSGRSYDERSPVVAGRLNHLSIRETRATVREILEIRIWTRVREEAFPPALRFGDSSPLTEQLKKAAPSGRVQGRPQIERTHRTIFDVYLLDRIAHRYPRTREHCQGAIRRGGPQWAGYAGLDGPGQSWRTIRRWS